MVVKQIKVYVKPEHMNDYLEAQKVWNRETRKAPGYLGHFCGREPKEPNIVYLFFYWRSREDLDRWMANEHDRIAALARAEAHYERIEVCVLEEALPPGPFPANFVTEGADEDVAPTSYTDQLEPGTA